MFTSHGHHIFGTLYEKRSADMTVARCGGPGVCSECSKESTFQQNLVENQSLITGELTVTTEQYGYLDSDEKDDASEPQYLSDPELRLKCLDLALLCYANQEQPPIERNLIAKADAFFKYIREGKQENN